MYNVCFFNVTIQINNEQKEVHFVTLEIYQIIIHIYIYTYHLNNCMKKQLF